MQLTIKKKIIYCIDSSAILSGKPFYERLDHMVSTPKIEKEFTPGGRDYRLFQLLKERGLHIIVPSKQSMMHIENVARQHGEADRLSPADKELLALAYEIDRQGKSPVLICDDYSMQNIATLLSLTYKSVSQKGITNKFKWERRCRGCGRQVDSHINQCPICGSSVVHVVKKKTIQKI